MEGCVNLVQVCWRCSELNYRRPLEREPDISAGESVSRCNGEGVTVVLSGNCDDWGLHGELASSRCRRDRDCYHGILRCMRTILEAHSPRLHTPGGYANRRGSRGSCGGDEESVGENDDRNRRRMANSPTCAADCDLVCARWCLPCYRCKSEGGTGRGRRCCYCHACRVEGWTEQTRASLCKAD